MSLLFSFKPKARPFYEGFALSRVSNISRGRSGKFSSREKPIRSTSKALFAAYHPNEEPYKNSPPGRH
ncbi:MULTISPECIES: hypothetical protein [Bartonella]|uniref:hypothetical protein n=1 Tax=Bartonella TaxID=773 RepID=UPI0018DC4AED|nr:hypothetical protein [Bartonella choladocola]MBI0141058.1 hypothetical protein [Bartonella choladocola]